MIIRDLIKDNIVHSIGCSYIRPSDRINVDFFIKDYFLIIKNEHMIGRYSNMIKYKNKAYLMDLNNNDIRYFKDNINKYHKVHDDEEGIIWEIIL